MLTHFLFLMTYFFGGFAIFSAKGNEPSNLCIGVGTVMALWALSLLRREEETDRFVMSLIILAISFIVQALFG